MAKKKINTPKVAEVAEVQKEYYKVGAWSGIPQYQCDLCAFDTLEKPAMLAHLFQAHGEQVEGYEPAPTDVASSTGQAPLSAQPNDEKVFEIELKEVDQSVDDEGNVHRQFTIKE